MNWKRNFILWFQKTKNQNAIPRAEVTRESSSVREVRNRWGRDCTARYGSHGNIKLSVKVKLFSREVESWLFFLYLVFVLTVFYVLCYVLVLSCARVLQIMLSVFTFIFKQQIFLLELLVSPPLFCKEQRKIEIQDGWTITNSVLVYVFLTLSQRENQTPCRRDERHVRAFPRNHNHTWTPTQTQSREYKNGSIHFGLLFVWRGIRDEIQTFFHILLWLFSVS